MNDWKILGRYDANDGRKHCGLLLLKSKKSNFDSELHITHSTAKREGQLQIEALIVKLGSGITIGFVYCRTTPTNAEISALKKLFSSCDIFMGDLNISQRISSDQEKLALLCNPSKTSVLREITRSVSNNQLDYVFANEKLHDKIYATAFNNFISDHKAITVRVGLNDNKLSNEFKRKINFNQESHLKSMRSYTTSDSSSNEEDKLRSMSYSDDSCSTSSVRSMSVDDDLMPELQNKEPFSSRSEFEFIRRFKNVDQSTCWLNTCLQLIISALDHADLSSDSFTSNLGIELFKLFQCKEDKCLDPREAKNILSEAEDTRVALRLSELQDSISNPAELKRQTNAVKKLHFNLQEGQHCIRDFFICLQENQISWPDVSSQFVFSTSYTSICCGCNYEFKTETDHPYLHLQIPPDNANLNEYIEEYFNTSALVGRVCEDGCRKFTQAETRNQLTSAADSKFLIVLLTRAVETEGGYEINRNKIIATNDVFIRYEIFSRLNDCNDYFKGF